MKLTTPFKLLYNAYVKNDDRSKFFIAETLFYWFYPKKYFISDLGSIAYTDKKLIAYYDRFHTHYRGYDKKYIFKNLLNLVENIDADYAECGVYQGASSYLILQKYTENRLHIFDSFEGLSEPENIDGNYWSRGNLFASEDLVRKNLSEFTNFTLYKGWIPDRFNEVADKKFAFVHIDVDLYQPTLDSIRFFYSRMLPGAVILCDDYGSVVCPGAKRAFDEFFEDKDENIVALPEQQCFIIKK